MFCTKCGDQIDEGKNFCGNCGARVVREAEPASDTGTRPFAAAPAETSSGNKSLVIAGAIAFVLIAGAAGLYFGTDLLRKSDYPEIPPADERPGRSAATVGAPPPMDDRPGRPAGTVGAPPPSATRPSPPAVASRRTADAGVYETLRDTSVFETPSASSKIVASIPAGTRVTVVGSAGSWLEVRSKTGKPPGFIRRSDATFVEKSG